MMRKLIVVLVTGMLLGAEARSDDTTVKEVEQAIARLNEAFQKRDLDTIKRLMTADHIAVTGYHGGPQNRTQQIDTLPDFKFTEYTPGKMKVTLLGKDVALVTYEVALKGTFKGKDMPPRNFASAVWVRRDGTWVEAFYQETPLGGK
jgi:uncharacterized protein (TIGR02246 family)